MAELINRKHNLPIVPTSKLLNSRIGNVIIGRISIRSENSITSYSIFFDKESRYRTSEDIIISKQIINSIACLHGIDYELSLELFDNEKLQRTHKIVK